jgi:hypothetical protein
MQLLLFEFVGLVEDNVMVHFTNVPVSNILIYFIAAAPAII